MTTRLQQLFDIIEKDRLALVARIVSISPERFHHSTGIRWSIAQIIAHLITSERLTLQYMQKKILGVSTLSDSGFREEVKMAMLKMSQRLPLKFTAPALILRLTPSYETVTDAIADWSAERLALLKFLDTISNELLKKKIYRHPVTGYMNIQHAILFFREHFHHHLPQIYRLS